MPLSFAFLIGAPGPGELILIFVVILVLFGPKRLPEIARMIGKMVRELHRASQDFRDQVIQIEESPTKEPEGDTSPEQADKEKNDLAG